MEKLEAGKQVLQNDLEQQLQIVRISLKEREENLEKSRAELKTSQEQCKVLGGSLKEYTDKVDDLQTKLAELETALQEKVSMNLINPLILVPLNPEISGQH